MFGGSTKVYSSEEFKEVTPLTGELTPALNSAVEMTIGQFEDPEFLEKLKSESTSIAVIPNTRVEKFQIQVGGNVSFFEMSPIVKGIKSLSPQTRQMMLMNPDGLGGIIIEEFRSEFGENHEKVAEALVHMSRIDLAQRDLDSQLVESRLREAIAIVGDASQPYQLATLVEARILLAEFLDRADRTEEANAQLKSAQTELESVSQKLDEDQVEFLKQEASRVASELKE